MITYKKVFLPALIFFLPYYLNAQLKGEQLTDSLKHSLRTSKEDTSRIKALFRLAKIYAANDSATAASYADACMKLSHKLNYQKGIGLSYLAMSSVNYSVSNYTASIALAQKAHDIFIKENDTRDLGTSFNTLGVNYAGMGNYVTAIEYYFKALQCFENINYAPNYSVEYGNIGVCYYYLHQYGKAIGYYKKALHMEYEKDNAFGIASNLDNIAITFLDEGIPDSANVYNLKAIPYFIKSNDMPGVSRIYSNRGNILMRLYDAKQAYDYFLKSLSITQKLNITSTTASDYGNIGDLYLELANDTALKFKVASFMKMDKNKLLDSSKYYLLKAVTESKKINDMETLMINDTLLSETQEKLGNYKAALAAFREYSVYKDSIFNDQNKQKLQALETQRLTEVKDQQIKLLNQQKALETSEVKRQTLIRNIIVMLVIAVALFAFVFIYLFNKKRKTKFDKQVKEVEMKALRAQMNPHFIFNSLHSINKYVIENDKQNASAYLSKFANLMRLILENSREQDVPLEKDLQALELYMQLEALRFSNKFSYSINTDASIDAENTLIPPMLLQPFVENAILHGVQNKENGKIKINVRKENEMICCVVEDNGNGRENDMVTDNDENKKHKPLATIIINERLNIINQLKKVKASVNIFDLKNEDNKYSGRRIELLLPLELAF